MFKRSSSRFLAFLFEQIIGLLHWLRLALIVCLPIASGIFGLLLGGEVAMYVWGSNQQASDMIVHFLIAGPFGCAGFYGVRYLLTRVRINR